jgi:hypothetical protein
MEGKCIGEYRAIGQPARPKRRRRRRKRKTGSEYSQGTTIKSNESVEDGDDDLGPQATPSGGAVVDVAFSSRITRKRRYADTIEDSEDELAQGPLPAKMATNEGYRRTNFSSVKRSTQSHTESTRGNITNSRLRPIEEHNNLKLRFLRAASGKYSFRCAPDGSNALYLTPGKSNLTRFDLFPSCREGSMRQGSWLDIQLPQCIGIKYATGCRYITIRRSMKKAVPSVLVVEFDTYATTEAFLDWVREKLATTTQSTVPMIEDHRQVEFHQYRRQCKLLTI